MFPLRIFFLPKGTEVANGDIINQIEPLSVSAFYFQNSEFPPLKQFSLFAKLNSLLLVVK